MQETKKTQSESHKQSTKKNQKNLRVTFCLDKDSVLFQDTHDHR